MKRKKARVLPADWTEVVGKVQEILTQTEKEAGEREKTQAIQPSGPSIQKSAAWKDGLEQFEERLQLFQARVQRAEDDASEAELALADGEKALEHWLARAADVSRRVREVSPNESMV